MVHNTPFRIFVGLSLIALVLIGRLYLVDRQIFQRFVGDLNPLIIAVAIVIMGCLLVLFLSTKGWFAIYTHNLRGLAIALSLGILLSVIMIGFDRVVILPADINVVFPQSMLFYPSIAYVVEVLFHLVPITVMLILLPRLFPNVNPNTLIWISIVLVSLLEPVYQVANLDHYSSIWVLVYLGLHLFVSNLIQLSLFKHYDFVTMYAYRLSYYAVWHILWGHIRLQLLF